MVTIPRRFNGPEHSGNGGWVCGLVAAEVRSPVVEVTLQAPPPLESPLVWERHQDVVRLETTGGAVIASGREAELAGDPPTPPTSAQAAAGARDYRGLVQHPFPRCFTCGPDRAPGDGLRLFTGPVGEGIVAGTWVADPGLAPEGEEGLDLPTLDLPTTWAALDCPGGWAADFTRQTMVLGRMSAQVLRPPVVGEELRSVGLLREQDGRKFRTATALYGVGDELLGRAEQTWIQVDPSRFA